MYVLQRFPLHLKYVVTLPCEIPNFQKCYRIFTLNAIFFIFNLHDLPEPLRIFAQNFSTLVEIHELLGGAKTLQKTSSLTTDGRLMP